MNDEQLAAFIGSIETHNVNMAATLETLVRENANREAAVWSNLCDILAQDDDVRRREYNLRLRQAQQQQRHGIRFGRALLGLPQ